MKRYKLVVLSEPVEGREQEYNDWYQNTHLYDIVAFNGFTSAQRFHASRSLNEEKPVPYLAIYDIETDDIDAVVEEMGKHAGGERMPMTEAIGPKIYAVAYEEFGPIVTRASKRP